MNSIISVITPSYNQASFIADTIKSILSQEGDFYIDYVIVDGASSDGSQKIIAHFEAELKANCIIEKHHGLEFYVAKNDYVLNRCKGISYRWISEKDNGHGDALNKGFALTIGDIMCWLNSDDIYHEGAFQSVFEIFNEFQEVKWLTGLNSKSKEDGSRIEETYLSKYNYKNVYSFLTNDYEWIQQVSTFWKRTLWVKAGSKINANYKFMVDGELWCRFFLHEDIYHVHAELASYRLHTSNRAHQNLELVNNEMKQAVRYLESNVKKEISNKAKALIENAPLQNVDYNDINFKIIIKDAEYFQWKISEVDFFKYTSKRTAARYKASERLLNNQTKTLNDKLESLRKIINKKDAEINFILNSRRFKTGSMILYPIKKIILTVNQIFNHCSIKTKKSVNFLHLKSLSKLSYPLLLDWNKITTPDKYIFYSNKKYNEFLKRALKAILKSDPKIPLSIETDFLFVKSMIRSDYNSFFADVISKCNADKKLINIIFHDTKNNKTNLILKLVWYFPLFLRLFDFRFKVSLYRYFRAISYIGVWKVFKTYKFNYLITFADMQGVENMLVQYFNKKGINTTTLQHGLYIDYSAFDNINRVNYESVVSQHFLAWGEETKELIQRYHPKVNVHICGKPIYFRNNLKSGVFFTLVFDQRLFIPENEELLHMAYDVARNLKTKVHVRLHPWDYKERYKFEKDLTLFDQDIASSIFVIGHTTSMIFECMRNGIPAFKYKTKYPSNVINDDLTFTNAEELIHRINNIDQYNFTELGKYYLEYVGDESLKKYAEFFNSLKYE